MNLVRVFASFYLGLRSRYPNAFAIRATRGGFEGFVETNVVKKVSS